MQVNEIDRMNKEGKVSYKVTLPGKKVDEALERVYKDLVKRVAIPGFRKGKVPRKVLEVRVGKEYFQEEAKRILLEESYYEAMKNISEKTLKQDVDDIVFEEGKDFSYTIKIDTVPEVEIPEKNYKNVTVNHTDEAYTDEKLEKNIEETLKKHATFEDAPEGTVEDKDIAIIDFLGKVDGEPFEGGEAKDHSLTIGSGSFIDNFEEQLIGLKVGDKKDVEVKFPEDYREKTLAGKPAVFEVEIKNIKKVQMPEMNEDLLKKLNYETEEKMREDIKEKTVKSIESANKNNLEGKIIEKIAESTDVEVPEAMIDFIIDRHMQEFEQNIKRYFPNMSIEDYLKATNSDINQLRANYKESAQKQAKVELIMKNIAKQEKIEVTEEDRDNKLNTMAESMNQDAKKLREVIQMQGNMSLVDEEILMEKTIEFLKDNADIQNGK